MNSDQNVAGTLEQDRRPVTQAVILAAGLGTRLRPFTESIPKPMLEVGGKPVLQRNIENLPTCVSEVILVVRHLQEKIRSYFGEQRQGRRITYVEQKELNGTGGALRLCQPLLEEKFLVMNGDDLYGTADIERALVHELAMMAWQCTSAGRFGAFRTDSQGRLLDIIEAAEVGSGSLVNAGLYVLDKRFFEYPLVPIKNGAEFGLPQTIARMAKDHPVNIVKAEFWMPVGTAGELEKANRLFNAVSNQGHEFAR